MKEIIFGTGNSAKIAYAKRALEGLPLHVVGLKQAAEARGILLPEIKETGNTQLENAELKAESYFRLFKSPVFSCDSGLYLWNNMTGEPLPKEEQPGIHVRGRGEHRLSDDELLAHYIGLVKKYGQIRARYKNAVCLIWDDDIRESGMGEDLWGEAFLLTDVPHKKRVPGFPLDGISLDLKTQKYFYDMEGNSQDDVVSNDGFRHFFCNFLEKYNLK